MISLLLVLPTFLVAADPSTAPAFSTSANAAHAPLVRQEKESFLISFRRAMKIKATDEMARLVRSRKADAISCIVSTCDTIGAAPNDQSELDIAALRQAWKTVDGGDFVNIQYEFHSLLQPEYRKARRKAVAGRNKAYRRLDKAKSTKDPIEFNVAGDEFRALALSFEKIGDHFEASQAWLGYADCFGKGLRGADADLPRVFEGFDSAVKGREKVDLKDRFYHGAKEMAESLERAGHGSPNKGEAADAKVKRTAESSKGTRITTTHEFVNDLDGIVRPLYTGVDSLIPMWASLQLAGNDSFTVFPALKGGPRVIRTAAAVAMIDTDLDGVGDMKLALTGNVTPVTIEIGKDEDKREWSFLATIGGDQDTYQGMRFNLAPTSTQLSLYIAPASARSGMIGDTAFRVFDDNMDGDFGSDPIDWGHMGVLDEHFQHDMDCVHFAGDKRARPWSPLQKVGDIWYHFESKRHGLEIETYATEVKEGKFKLSYKGVKPDWLIVKGISGDGRDCYFDLVGGVVDVPEGAYQLFCGQISTGKRGQKAKALVLPGEGMETWDVQPGKTVVAKLGGPFKFVFDLEQDDESVTVKDYSIAVQGSAGETYQRLWNCVPLPQALARAAGKKKGSKLGKLRPSGSAEEVTVAGYRSAWFPREESFKKKKAGDVEVQLFEKKNKLFGKVQSDWKK